MIFTLIIFLLIVIFMAFFIGKNLTNVCTLWIFKTFENLPVAVLVLIAFGAGIVFSLLLMLIFKLKHSGTAAEETVPVAKDKSEKTEKIEKKIKKLKEKKSKGKKSDQNAAEVSDSSSDPAITADKTL